MALTDDKIKTMVEKALLDVRFEPIEPSVKVMADDTIAIEIPLNFARKYAELITAHIKQQYNIQ